MTIAGITQVKFFHIQASFEGVEKTVNHWLQETELAGHTIESITFQDNPRGDEYQNASTVVMVRYKTYDGGGT